jgi:hypothetical protein
LAELKAGAKNMHQGWEEVGAELSLNMVFIESDIGVAGKYPGLGSSGSPNRA